MRFEKFPQALPLLCMIALALTLALPAMAERGDDADRKSKNGLTSGTIDGVEVTIEYGRPKVKGRKIWGDLVPYGKVWRTGANEATTVAFSTDVKIQGEALAAGTYSLFTIPTEAGWTVIFNKTAEQWGAFSYDPALDALRVEAKVAPADATEALEFVLEDSDVVLKWEKLAVSFTVEGAG